MAEYPGTIQPKQSQTILPVVLNDRAALYLAYMPFLKNGGLFIPTNKKYRLGDEIFLLLNLMDEPEKFHIGGQVVWITPESAQNNRRAGIGVQFNDVHAAQVRSKIEAYLAGLQHSHHDTHTI